MTQNLIYFSQRPQPSKPFRRHGKIDSHGEGANKDGKKDTARGGGRSSTDSALANMDLEKRVKKSCAIQRRSCHGSAASAARSRFHWRLQGLEN